MDAKVPETIEEEHIELFKKPSFHVAEICFWQDLSVNDIDILWDLGSAKLIKSFLADKFLLTDYITNIKSTVTLDLYYYAFDFARRQNYTKEQVSAFFSILKKTHEVAIETPFGNVHQCFAFFREMMLCHSVKRPPHSIDLFEPEAVRTISEYVINTYFRHFKLYKYVYTPIVHLDLSLNYIGMPPSPRSSIDEGDEGVSQVEANGENQDYAEKNISELVPEDTESASSKELKKLVMKHFAVEIEKVKSDLESQIKSLDTEMESKLNSVGEPTTGAPNLGKTSQIASAKKK